MKLFVTIITVAVLFVGYFGFMGYVISTIAPQAEARVIELPALTIVGDPNADLSKYPEYPDNE